MPGSAGGALGAALPPVRPPCGRRKALIPRFTDPVRSRPPPPATRAHRPTRPSPRPSRADRETCDQPSPRRSARLLESLGIQARRWRHRARLADFYAPSGDRDRWDPEAARATGVAPSLGDGGILASADHTVSDRRSTRVVDSVNFEVMARSYASTAPARVATVTHRPDSGEGPAPVRPPSYRLASCGAIHSSAPGPGHAFLDACRSYDCLNVLERRASGETVPAAERSSAAWPPAKLCDERDRLRRRPQMR
jgi:hypothetical protein